MYRLIFNLLLCLHAAAPAPQTHESDVTYVKIQPVVDDSQPDTNSSVRESRIKKLPLTIPGNITTDGIEPNETENLNTSTLNSDFLDRKPSEIPDVLNAQYDDLSVIAPVKSIESDEISPKKSPDLSDDENLSESATTDNTNTDSDLDLSVNPTDDLSESDSEQVSDTVPSETNQSDRRARNFETVETTETTAEATDKYDEVIDHTVIEIPRTSAPPKFVPKVPKLSYFQKPRVFQSYSSNHVEKGIKRRFRSRCRCEKIWNCPKLQISVPRCPNEYFLCCF